MKKVRTANRYDIDDIIILLREYSKHSPITVHQTIQNEEYVRTLITCIIMGQGKIFLALNDDSTVGMLICIRQPNIWNKDIYLLQELAWYIYPEYRNTTLGYRLYTEYKNYATELLNTNKIVGYTLSKMSTSPNLNYERLGFEKIEETYIGK